MHVPLLDLKAQYKSLKPDLDAAMIRVAESQVCVLGAEVEQLERTMAKYCGTRFALGVSSGTDALLMALMALGIGAGDEVIVPTFSFFATAGVVMRLGAMPVFVDSEARGLNLDPARLEERITPRTKAIIPVHLFGQCAAMQAIMSIAAKYSIPVIEDAAQAIGAEYNNGQKAGTMGLMGCFSFYPTKNLGAFGDAGLITTNDEDLYIKLKQMRNHGMEPRYYHKFVGGNFRMDALQAAVLNVKFAHLESWHQARRSNAALYNQLFVQHGLAEESPKHEPCSGLQDGFPRNGFSHCPHCATSSITAFNEANTLLLPEMLGATSGVKNHHIFHQYTLRTPLRDKLRAYLAEHGIGAEIYYPVPLHKQECFAHLASNDSNDAEFRVANCAAAHVLSLPIYPELQEAQLYYVVERIAAFYQK
ncbi:MAG: DegT/DnrJ/EryC1/StrS family aminotransferase [Candidatus Kapaibacterium sp.]|nr:MAG: DegT/DnrJ/EryC1/StrS family aminotransferase [Candidatus Kapabacteria bacterium]